MGWWFVRPVGGGRYSMGEDQHTLAQVQAVTGQISKNWPIRCALFRDVEHDRASAPLTANPLELSLRQSPQQPLSRLLPHALKQLLKLLFTLRFPQQQPTLYTCNNNPHCTLATTTTHTLHLQQQPTLYTCNNNNPHCTLATTTLHYILAAPSKPAHSAHTLAYRGTDRHSHVFDPPPHWHSTCANLKGIPCIFLPPLIIHIPRPAYNVHSLDALHTTRLTAVHYISHRACRSCGAFNASLKSHKSRGVPLSLTIALQR
jgi:hypothetical protein